MPNRNVFESPLVARNASRAMGELFGARHRILTWRRVWLALAEGQRQAGLPISAHQVRQLERTLENVDFARAARYERQTRHDVMAHLHAWGEAAPESRSILHLGATSADITDNADLIIMRDALRWLAGWLANVIDALGRFARDQRSRATLGFTHYQPAQVTTVGKRAATWCYDFVTDLHELERCLATLPFRGIKGATGTQASFLALFHGDQRKVLALERRIARRFGFDLIEPVTGQTYSRKIDARVLGVLGGIAASVHKFANDLRLLANLKEIEEPFETAQVGSSAMPYKRNPMRCERATGLARFVIALVQSAYQTAAEQWLERTLDDSSNRRLTIPEAFLATDGMLRLVTNVARGLVVYPRTIAVHLRTELPFLATENILMAAVQAGGDRQKLHERLRIHAQEAGRRVKQEGGDNDLLDRLARDPAFAAVNLRAAVDPKRFVGRAPQQVDELLRTYVVPIRRRYRADLGRSAELEV
ncbi:MAG TPA: adenylosuccinate lyase [Phycisphaerae bacterium]|nr:adenylosuccinate lyase [Phycisphaerae bacterium]HNU44906.1 adenylosuccinate lyase [Phycisphaerae bacterium]